MRAIEEIEKYPYLKTALQALRKLSDFRSLSYLELGCGDGFILEALSADGMRSLRGTTYRKACYRLHSHARVPSRSSS